MSDLLGLGKAGLFMSPEEEGLIAKRISELQTEKDDVLADAFSPADVSPGTAIGRLLAVAAPLLISGRGGVGAENAANLLALQSQQDREDVKFKGERSKIKASSIGEQMKALETKMTENREAKRDIGKTLVTEEIKNEYEKDRMAITQSFDLKKLALSQGAQDARQSRTIEAQKQIAMERVDRSYANAEKLAQLRSDLAVERAKKIQDAKGDKARAITEKTALDLGGIDYATEAIKTIDIEHTDLRNWTSPIDRGFYSGANALTGGLIQNDESRYKSKVRVAAQIVGKWLEGGKLTDADYESKYVPFFPSPVDTETTAKEKVSILQQMLSSRAKQNVESLDKAGFDVTPFLSDLKKTAPKIEKDPNADDIVIINGKRMRVK